MADPSPWERALADAAPAAAAAATEVVAVDLQTGEAIVDLNALDTADLARVAALLAAREREFREFRAHVEEEVIRRLDADGRTMAVVGDYEVRVASGRSREWDPEDLRETVKDLAGQGILEATEVAGLLRTEVKVDGKLAVRLLGRLSGDPLTQLSSCFTWKTGKRKLEIERSVDLAAALPPGEQ